MAVAGGCYTLTHKHCVIVCTIKEKADVWVKRVAVASKRSLQSEPQEQWLMSMGIYSMQYAKGQTERQRE